MRTWWVCAIVLVAACGGSGGGGPDASAPDASEADAAIDAASLPIDAGPDAAVTVNPGFTPPTSPTRANQRTGGAWIDVGPADWSCLGQPTTDQPSTTAIALSGRLTDYQTGTGVGAATITAFAMGDPGSALGTSTTSNLAATRGDYAMTVAPLPTGVRRYGFRIEATAYLRTYALARYLTPGATQTHALSAFAESTANALTAFIGLTRDPTRALVVGSLVDCQGRRVSNAVATVSAAAGVAAHLTGADTYYFSAGSTSLPVRHSQRAATAGDGLFMVLGVPPAAAAYAQVWGFRDAAELASGTLTLLGEAPIVAAANVADDVALEPRRAP